MASTSSVFESILRRAVGALFVATGAFKLALWPAFFAFCGGVASQVLAPALPQVLGGAAREAMLGSALLVPPLEVACGVLLWRGQGRSPRERAAAALLALDMAGAIATVGVPGRLGKSVEVGGGRVGAEPWRLGLEVGLLLACAWLALHKSQR